MPTGSSALWVGGGAAGLGHPGAWQTEGQRGLPTATRSHLSKERKRKQDLLPPSPRHSEEGGAWPLRQDSPGHHLGPKPPSPHQALSPSLSALCPSAPSLDAPLPQSPCHNRAAFLRSFSQPLPSSGQVSQTRGFHFPPFLRHLPVAPWETTPTPPPKLSSSILQEGHRFLEIHRQVW